MSYEVVVFDWDGTLADSTGGIVQCIQYAAQKIAISPRSDFDVQQIIGLGLTEAIQTLWPEHRGDNDLVNQMSVAYGEFYMSEQRPRIKLFDHAHDLLEGLGQRGLELAVATGKARRGLQRAFKETGIEHHFSASRCADETRSKPHPMMLKELSTQLRIQPERMLMVGDTQFDIEMAHRAGMDAVALSHGAHSHEKLTQASPLCVLKDLKELQQFISSSLAG